MSLIPVTILTGFLGSGKTTVLNHLVRQPELADALVIINEFGQMPLDHLLVAHSADDQVMEMSNGCLCCTIRGDLVKTLRDITWRFSRQGQRQFGRILIETTGLADPAPIIHTLMTHPQIASKYQLDGIVTAVDMATGMQTLDQHPVSLKQAAMADVLLLNKTDLVSDEQTQQLLQRLDHLNPAAPRYSVSHGEIAAANLLNLGLFNVEGKTAEVSKWLKAEAYRPRVSYQKIGQTTLASGIRQNFRTKETSPPKSRYDDNIHAFCFSFSQPISEAALNSWLEMLLCLMGSNVLRIKGILNIAGKTNPLVIHGVQHLFRPPETLPAWPNEDRHSHLVFITQYIQRASIERTFSILGQATYADSEII